MRKRTKKVTHQVNENPGDALSQLGISAEAVDEYLSHLPRRPTNRQICTCGHPMSKHSESVAGAVACVTGNLWCPCTKPFAIVDVDDVRYFMRESHGRGAKHALSIGLRRLQKAGKQSRLLIQPHCFMCQSTLAGLEIVGIDRNGGVASSAAPVNALLCEPCTLRLMGFPVVET
jgi:hypothetical protein